MGIENAIEKLYGLADEAMHRDSYVDPAVPADTVWSYGDPVARPRLQGLHFDPLTGEVVADHPGAGQRTRVSPEDVKEVDGVTYLRTPQGWMPTGPGEIQAHVSPAIPATQMQYNRLPWESGEPEIAHGYKGPLAGIPGASSGFDAGAAALEGVGNAVMKPYGALSSGIAGDAPSYKIFDGPETELEHRYGMAKQGWENAEYVSRNPVSSFIGNWVVPAVSPSKVAKAAKGVGKVAALSAAKVGKDASEFGAAVKSLPEMMRGFAAVKAARKAVETAKANGDTELLARAQNALQDAVAGTPVPQGEFGVVPDFVGGGSPIQIGRNVLPEELLSGAELEAFNKGQHTQGNFGKGWVSHTSNLGIKRDAKGRGEAQSITPGLFASSPLRSYVGKDFPDAPITEAAASLLRKQGLDGMVSTEQWRRFANDLNRAGHDPITAAGMTSDPEMQSIYASMIDDMSGPGELDQAKVINHPVKGFSSPEYYNPKAPVPGVPTLSAAVPEKPAVAQAPKKTRKAKSVSKSVPSMDPIQAAKDDVWAKEQAVRNADRYGDRMDREDAEESLMNAQEVLRKLLGG